MENWHTQDFSFLLTSFWSQKSIRAAYVWTCYKIWNLNMFYWKRPFTVTGNNEIQERPNWPWYETWKPRRSIDRRVSREMLSLSRSVCEPWGLPGDRVAWEHDFDGQSQCNRLEPLPFTVSLQPCRCCNKMAATADQWLRKAIKQTRAQRDPETSNPVAKSSTATHTRTHAHIHLSGCYCCWRLSTGEWSSHTQFKENFILCGSKQKKKKLSNV